MPEAAAPSDVTPEEEAPVEETAAQVGAQPEEQAPAEPAVAPADLEPTRPAAAEMARAAPGQPHDFAPSAFAGQFGDDERRTIHPAVLWRLPMALAVHSGDVLHHANRAFLNLTGYGTLHELEQAGGLDAIFAGSYEPADASGRKLRLRRRGGEELPVDAFLQSIDWNGRRALLLALTRAVPVRGPVELVPDGEAGRDRRIAELGTIIDTATDGVVLIDERRHHPLDQPAGGGAVRLRQRGCCGQAIRRAVRHRKPAGGAGLSRGTGRAMASPACSMTAARLSAARRRGASSRCS